MLEFSRIECLTRIGFGIYRDGEPIGVFTIDLRGLTDDENSQICDSVAGITGRITRDVEPEEYRDSNGRCFRSIMLD